MCRRASIAFRVAAVSLALAAVAPAETIVPGGDLSTTTWTKAGSPYRVAGAIVVPAGETLSIEPGVSVLFDSAASLAVVGRLAAIGTETDSIRFLPGGAPAWHGLVIGGGDSSTIRFARVSGVAGSGIAIAGNGTRTGLSRSVLSGCNAGSGSRGGGIFVTGKARATLDSCRIAGSTAAYGGGAAVRDSAQATFRRCLIVKNAVTGVGGALVVETGGRATLVHVTIADNVATTHAGVYVSAATLVARNSVVRPAVAKDGRYPATIDVAYTLTGGVSGPGVFSADPVFVDSPNGDYRIGLTSPCRDAGDPASPHDVDGSLADIGAFATLHPASVVAGRIGTTKWRKASSPYYVSDTATVAAGEVLTIEPGVEVFFSGLPYLPDGRLLRIEGRLVALGAEGDEIRINRGGWPGSGLTFAGGDTSTLRFVISNLPYDPTDAVLFADSARVGISRSSLLSGYSWADTGPTYEIRDHASVTFDSCAIEPAPRFNGNRAAIAITGGYAQFTACSISDFSGTDHVAVTIGANGRAVFRRCLVARNRSVPAGAFHVAGRLELDRLTLVGNIFTSLDGGTIVLAGGTLVARNCIFWSNTNGLPPSQVRIAGGAPSSATISWSLVLDGYAGEGNVAIDPLFVDRTKGNYRLRHGSPAIDAGDPASPLDPDGSRADMGYLPYDHATGVGGLLGTQVWTKSASPYRVAAACTVAVGARLTIEPGVDVTFATEAPFVVAGALDVRGTETDSVRFLCHSSYHPDSGWSGIRFIGHDTSAIAFARIGGVRNSPGREIGWYEPAPDLPGAIRVSETAVVRLRRTVVSGNTGWFGGGVRIDGGTVRLDTCAIVGNTARRAGGGVCVGPPRGGMPIDARASGCRIAGNEGLWGGGCAVFATGQADTIVFDECRFAANSGDGAAVYADSAQGTRFTGCIMSGHWANYGHVVKQIDGRLAFIGTTITGNIGSAFISTTSANADTWFERCTIVWNRGFGIQLYNGSATIVNSIVWGNSRTVAYTGSDDEIIFDPSTQKIPAPYLAVRYSIVHGDTVIAGPGNVNADPLIGGAAFNTESDGVFLAAGSPAIDAGDPISPLDHDGSRADIGAFPFGSTVPAAITRTLAPPAFALAQNAPNPFNPSTVIRFSLAQSGEARLAIYDVTGRLVRVLVDGRTNAGAHEVAWDGTDAAGRRVASGIYVYRLAAKEGTIVRRMALVR